MKNAKQHLIYALRDPDTFEVRYIGRSSIGMGRPNYHMKHSFKKLDNGSWVSELYVHRWIRLLSLDNKKPIIDIIEQFNELQDVNNLLNEAEIKWIAKFKSEGCKLTNSTDGGMGILGYHHTAEAIEKIREASRNQIWTDERKNNISNSLKGESNPCFGKSSNMKDKHHSDETREKLRQANIGSKHPERTGDNHWTHKQGRGPNTGKKMTQEWKANMIASLKGRKLSDKEIECRSKKVICLNDNAEYSSQKEASFAKGISNLTVSRCCRDGKERSGFRFAFAEQV